jgi:hypothetical protein
MTRWVAIDDGPEYSYWHSNILCLQRWNALQNRLIRLSTLPTHNSASAVFLESFADRIELNRYRSVDETETIDRQIQTQTKRATSERLTNI